MKRMKRLLISGVILLFIGLSIPSTGTINKQTTTGNIIIVDTENNPPYPPTISGTEIPIAGVEYCWIFQSIDPDGDDIRYIIKWEFEIPNETDCHPSGIPVEACHSYMDAGVYFLSAKAKECTQEGKESDWSYLMIYASKCKMNLLQNPFWYRVLERFPLLQLLLDNLR
jgi:hypothetical protein